ncbi:non-hydrolyzing UDP-N-acetylglucosamine 2-epimerase [Brevundimonas sp. Root1423]|uniref:non-hydrolyzing UDP-N-acetylglucosamine 2-epimerase n=1 Tax=Brevundimonas sp. Root1423 TaxID=1736462 RepID=UPI001F449D83|nr:UDP-N-acetylglucosamine 2-epimerase (non-hydrolyzing) [Brevundimonas sp. Root1423]
MTVVGTRPEIIRLSRVISELERTCDHTLVHTGQNYDYELNEIFFEDLGLRKPDHFLECAGATAAETIGQIIVAMDRLLEAAAPDALLVLGDTNSCLSVLPAKRRRIPIFHMEAGNRCFDERVPEEMNRRIVDHVADVNLTYSDIARTYLLAEGRPADRVIKTGSPMFEVLQHNAARIDASDAVERLELKPFEYFLVSAHREENIESDRAFGRLCETLDAVATQYGLPVIVSTHPRTRKRIEAAARTFSPNIRLLKPLGFLDYVNLQKNARAVLSDSGTINEESSILNFPALNLREAHERPEAMEEASVMMCGLGVERVLQCLRIALDQPRGKTRLVRPVGDYSMPNVSSKVVRIIHSYVDYVRRVVWRNYD